MTFLILQEDGLKGEVHTTMPIEKVSVSEQGIVSAILKNDTSMKVICYDTAGNVLVEHKTSLAGTGYPVDVALSANGEVMQVVYLYTRMDRWCQDYIIITSGKPERMKPIIKYPVRIIRIRYWPRIFMDADTSVAIGDDMAIYSGKEVPKQSVKIKMDKRDQSVFHNEKYIGMILKNQGKGGYELRLYNKTEKLFCQKI